jgi:hypothetical protein
MTDKIKLTCVMIEADVPTANGRVYPKDVLLRAVLDANSSNIAMLGQLGNPTDGKTRMDKVSHEVTELTLSQKGNIEADIKVLSTPEGQILTKMLEDKIPITLLPRGMGSVNENGVVGEDFKIVSMDIGLLPE